MYRWRDLYRAGGQAAVGARRCKESIRYQDNTIIFQFQTKAHKTRFVRGIIVHAATDTDENVYTYGDVASRSAHDGNACYAQY